MSDSYAVIQQCIFKPVFLYENDTRSALTIKLYV